MILVLMGVAGSGKTTIGRGLAKALGCPFYDGDDFHLRANKEKMGRGVPLTDEDRMPWLQKLHAEMNVWEGKGPITVLACSALKQKYRDLLSQGNPVQWVYLKVNREVLHNRLERRKDHYAGQALLESQLETLEEPSDAWVMDVRQEPQVIIDALVEFLKGKRSS
jgi:gluconokinase